MITVANLLLDVVAKSFKMSSAFGKVTGKKV